MCAALTWHQCYRCTDHHNTTPRTLAMKTHASTQPQAFYSSEQNSWLLLYWGFTRLWLWEVAVWGGLLHSSHCVSLCLKINILLYYRNHLECQTQSSFTAECESTNGWIVTRSVFEALLHLWSSKMLIGNKLVAVLDGKRPNTRKANI